MDWLELESDIRLLASKIEQKPDVIIGVIRGGVIPARLLCSLFYLRRMYCVSVTAGQLTTEISDDLSQARVLVVEDILETGTTLRTVCNWIAPRCASVESTALYLLDSCKIEPTYFLRRIPRVITLPWEIGR